MIKITDGVYPSPEQWNIVIRGMRNPMNSWDKSDSFLIECFEKWVSEPTFTINGKEYNEYDTYKDKGVYDLVKTAYPNYYSTSQSAFHLGEKDLELARKLISAGSEHRKFLQQLEIVVNIKAPLYFWKQFDTYRLGVTKNSCSTMHKLTEKEFSVDDFSADGIGSFSNDDFVWGEVVPSLDTVIFNLNEFRDKYLKEDDKRYWSAINELLPQSYNQLRTVSLNYETLFNICKQRAGHKLDEWRYLIFWAIDEVPYFAELCFDKLCKDSISFDKMFNGSEYEI